MPDVRVHMECHTDAPHLCQDQSTGDLYASNVHLIIRGQALTMRRGLNSRVKYALYIQPEDLDDDLYLMNEDGTLTDEFKNYIRED